MARINLKNIFSKKKSEPKNDFIQFGMSDSWSGANLIAYDGEKTPLELGTPFDFKIDYYLMRQRAWESFLMSDVVQNAVEKHCKWLIGAGLKFQAEPINDILIKNKIEVNIQEISKDLENSFRLFANSNNSTYEGNYNLHQLGFEALKNALLSGDCLCINRLVDGIPTLQIIDGCFVQTPVDKMFDKTIKQGVKLNAKGGYEGFYIRKIDGTYEYILAKNSLNQTIAWLFVCRRYKITDVRGMSLLSAVLESVSKIDRYKDATLGHAEENSKIPYTIEHDVNSTGENPMINQLAQSVARQNGQAPETKTNQTDVIATKVAMTTNKQTYNMPVGSKLVNHDNKTDVNFKDFFYSNLDIIYACLDIPAEVALDKFEGSYSSSRAALKSFEYSLTTKRKTLLTNQFYKPFYNFWLDIYVLQKNVSINGYIDALRSNNYMLMEAFKNCRFIGASVPHIDPLKEVNAERKKLGSTFDSIPLTTAEQACENLNTGDFDQNILKATNEKSISTNFEVVEPAKI